MGPWHTFGVLLLAMVVGCGRIHYDLLDAGGDAPDLDAPGLDATRLDASGLDAATLDAPRPDAATLDAPGRDAPSSDASPDGSEGAPDATSSDTGPDGSLDATPSSPDAPLSDAGHALTCFPAATRFDDVGLGTAVAPYLLCNLAQWRSFVADGVRTASYRLEADLDIDDTVASFAGSFDGGGHVLRGPAHAQPLFGALTGATITNLRLERGTTGSPFRSSVGVLVGTASGTTIRGVEVDTSVGLSGRRQVGGLVGLCAACTIEDVAVRIGTLTAESQAGIVVGSANGSTLRGVNVVGGQIAVMAGGCPLLGGVVGDATDTSIAEARVEVSILSTMAGGFGGVSGAFGGTQAISDVEVLGEIRGSNGACPVGGVTGSLGTGGRVDRALVAAIVVGGGGLAGSTDATATRIQNAAYVGGGLAFPSTTVVSCSATTMVTNVHYVYTGEPPGAAPPCAVPDGGHPAILYFFDAANAPLSSWNFAATWTELPGALPTLRNVRALP